MLAQYLDLTDEFNANSVAYIELSNYDYAVVQIVAPSDVVYFLSTLDSGAVQGETDGDISTSTNYTSVGCVDLVTQNYVNQSGSSFLGRFDVTGRYLKIDGTDNEVVLSKLLVMLTKIS